jgi:hypothetical protein
MTQQFPIRYIFRIKEHVPVSGDDTHFYRGLPEVKEKYYDDKTGQETRSRRDWHQVFTVVGTALLSSTVLAAYIKAYLATNRVKIKVSLSGKKTEVTFEGRDVQKSEADIAKMIDIVAKKRGKDPVSLRAEPVPESDQSTAATADRTNAVTTPPKPKDKTPRAAKQKPKEHR